MLPSWLFQDKKALHEIGKAYERTSDFLFSIDPSLVEQYIDLLDKKSVEEAREDFSREHGENIAEVTESVIESVGRPALVIQNQTFEVPELDSWKEILETNRRNIERAIPAVGIIELRDHPRLKIAGTGWLIDNNVIVTNRHVADTFARRKANNTFHFRKDNGRTIRAKLDFREEHRLDKQAEFFVESVLFMEKDEDDLPDIAFLKIRKSGIDEEGVSVSLSSQHLTLATSGEISNVKDVAAIGYPGRNLESLTGTGITRADLRGIFNGDFSIKRLMPGKVLHDVSQPGRFLAHDCSTLAGASGSPLINLRTGKVVGLHFAGNHGLFNRAVPADVIRDYLSQLT